MNNWGLATSHTFSMQIWANGVVHIVQPVMATLYDTVTGIGPGLGNNPMPEKDLSALLAPNSYAGVINESFYQWFGIVTLHPYYTQSNDPYDLFGKTLTWIPNGIGGLPNSTFRYAMY
jgi:hypothetical protein